MNVRFAAPALFAALLFGASIPLAKWLGTDVAPLMLAGLLYLGSGLGLAALLSARLSTGRVSAASLTVARTEWPWLLAAIVAGGMLGPALLLMGLSTTDAASTSLLLNLEGVFTALLAWVAFKENVDRQLVLGMVAIVVGGALLSWQPGHAQFSTGSLLIIGACLLWALDNNLTRKVSNNDAMLVACLKGSIAGATNTVLALLTGQDLPPLQPLMAILVVGFAGYGLSLALFVVALRTLGSARTGAYFSIAPFFGVTIALLIWPSVPPWPFWLAAALMALGLWLHLRERHEHAHSHTAMEHGHRHRHGAHHQHAHDFDWDGVEPHVHPHVHQILRHSHAHYPDIHHQHRHRAQN